VDTKVHRLVTEEIDYLDLFFFLFSLTYEALEILSLLFSFLVNGISNGDDGKAWL